MDNENIEPVVTELGLALGCSGYRVGRRLSSNDLGAGANAASRIDMTYVATDPLSEIVWSPNKGLCLKCTQCSFSKIKPSLVWGAGADHSLQEMTSARSGNEKPIDEQNIDTSSSTFPDLNTKVSDIDNSDKSARDNDNIRSCHEPQTDNDNSFRGMLRSAAFVNLDEKIDPRDSENNQVADIAKPIENNTPSSSDGQKQDVLMESLINDPGNEVGDVGDQTRLLSRMHMVLVSKVHTDKAENDLKGLSEDECLATSKFSDSESAPEAEKNSQCPKGIPSKKMSGDKHSPTSSVIRRCRERGKEKALSGGDVKGMVSKSEDEDRHESVESCNSATILSAGKKRCSFEHQLIVGSKRVKRQIHDENHCSSSIVKHDSSFVNWISNMMKGFTKLKDEMPSLALTTAANINRSHDSPDEDLDAADRNQDPEHRNIGFQSIFHSTYSPKTKVQGTPPNENDQAGLDELTNNLETKETKLQCPQEPLSTFGKEIKEASIGFSSLRSKDSEPVASLFARRLDALKHMIPSGVPDNRTSSTVTCCFCGRKGHHLQYCPEITDNETGHILRNMKSSDKFEKLPRVCIRCFQLNHWAVSCPTAGQPHPECNASSLASFRELQGHARVEENTKLLDGNQEAIVGRTVRGHSTLYEVNADNMKSNTNVNKKYVISSSKEIKHWGNSVNTQVSDTPKAIFDAVRLLRLSRTDVLKWKNSPTSVSHLEGFFLRLRLTKWEKGSGGTGYYVACITEANKQGMQQNSKKSIAVNVGGIKCLVESKYISNHDFLEDELTAWLRATKNSGGKIPSEEELTVKDKERRMLGF